MSHRLWLVALVSVVLVLNAYPIYQLVSTGGYLFYTNAWDETSYLQYDFSRQVQGIFRFAQYFVTLGHTIGLSAGWMNFLFDLVAMSLFVLALRGVFNRAGFEPTQANLHSLLLALFPVVFTNSNSLLNRLFWLNFSSDFVSWVTIPSSNFLPVQRSPEPQFSLVILGFVLLLSLTRKTFLPLFLVLPFLYPFVAVPVAFIVLAVFLKNKFFPASQYGAIPAIISVAMIYFALRVYLDLFVDDMTREFLTESYSPIVSFSGLISIAIYLACFRRIREHLRYVCLLVALAPTVAVNQNIITGRLLVPNSFEICLGVYCASAVAILCLEHCPAAKAILATVAVVFFGLYAQTTFQDNRTLNKKIVFNEELAAGLKNDSRHVAISDTIIASRAHMIFPRQPITAFGYEQTFPVLAEKYFKEYVCTKREIMKDHQVAKQFARVFETLDEGYKYENRNFWGLHIGRKGKYELLPHGYGLIGGNGPLPFEIRHDPKKIPDNCPALHLQYVILGSRRSKG